MTTTYSTDDYNVEETADGRIILTKKQPRWLASNRWGWCWAVIPTTSRDVEFREAPVHIAVGIEGAKGHALRLAAEMNGEIKSAEYLLRMMVHQIDEGIAREQIRAWLDAGGKEQQ